MTRSSQPGAVESPLNDVAAADVLAAMSSGLLPETVWQQGDDNCDCTFQRYGSWTNPYLAETLEVRWCCIWAELSKLFPQFVRTVPAFFNYNTEQWEETPYEWDGDHDMPPALWYRQLARKTGRGVASIREEYAGKDELRPKAVQKPVAEEPQGEPEPDIIAVMLEMIDGLAQEIAGLYARLEAQP